MFYRKLEKFCLYPMITFFIAIHKIIFHCFFGYDFEEAQSTFQRPLK